MERFARRTSVNRANVYGANMRRLIFAAIILAAAAPAQAAERRCGWLSNPTPANWSLIDRPGEWLMGVQGGYQMPDKSWDKISEVPDSRWVKTNVNYGYGCACMTVRSQRSTMRILEVIAAKWMPLRQCRGDRRLPRVPE